MLSHFSLLCFSLSPARLSLTPNNLMPLLQGVRNWWKSEYFNDILKINILKNGLLGLLGVPKSKQQEIREQCGSDEEKAVAKCIEWWVNHATNVTWRDVIHSLDRANETKVADGIRQHAEPLTGINYIYGM